MKVPFLREGQAVGFFSPSSPVTAWAPKRVERGRRFLESKGLRVVAGSLSGSRDFWRSGSAEARAEELNALLRDPDIRCAMSTIGGLDTNAILPFVDFDALRADPKPIVGYSDVTALLFAAYAETGIPTYYGPALAASFGEMPPLVEETWASFEAVVMGRSPRPYSYPMPAAWTDERVDWESQSGAKKTRPNAWLCLRPGSARGRLIAGNLETMSGIWGTPYMPEILPGDILMIEDGMMSAGEIERSFAHLALAGVLDTLGGLILGKHELFDAQGSGLSASDLLREALANHDAALEIQGLPPLDYPVLAEFDSCHCHPMLCLPIGAEVELVAGSPSSLLLLEDAP